MVVAGGNTAPATQTKQNTMQTAQITAATPSIKCSLAIGTARVNQNKKKWNFNPAAKVRANGEIPELKPKMMHRIGSLPTKTKLAAAQKLKELQKNKSRTKQILALRQMTTETGKRCWLTPNNGKLKIGNRFATKAEKAQFAALL